MYWGAQMPGQNLQRIQCGCGNEHRLSPVALAVALQAFIDGDAQYVNGGVVESLCLIQVIERADHRRRKGENRMVAV